MKKPTKKDNTVQDKKLEKMHNLLNDLEEKFFKHVSEGDNEAADAIKQRGEHVTENYAQPKTQPSAA